MNKITRDGIDLSKKSKAELLVVARANKKEIKKFSGLNVEPLRNLLIEKLCDQPAPVAESIEVQVQVQEQDPTSARPKVNLPATDAPAGENVKVKDNAARFKEVIERMGIKLGSKKIYPQIYDAVIKRMREKIVNYKKPIDYSKGKIVELLDRIASGIPEYDVNPPQKTNEASVIAFIETALKAPTPAAAPAPAKKAPGRKKKGDASSWLE